MNRSEAIEQARIIKALITLTEVSKITGTFIKAFEEKSFTKEDGINYLHGNFNSGGTKSGRLSSSSPNLQNIPSTGNPHSKIVKKCFKPPSGWLFVGADFSSLEAKIGALLTKDPAKLGIYTEGYDMHSFNAFGYWGDKMPDIQLELTKANSIKERVYIINSIKDKYPEFRQASKTITFAAQYGGSYKTFMDSGFSMEEAKQIEANYNKLYETSITWAEDKIKQASKDGFVTCAFGLKLRTPIIGQVVMGTSSTPYEALAEARTAGNAMQQGYGLLNNRSAIEFQELLLNSEFRYNIKPSCHIHDAQYFLVKEDVDTIHWLNQNLIKCMSWQELPELKHDQVKLGAELDLFIPDWSEHITLPNGATKEQIGDILNEK